MRRSVSGETRSVIEDPERCYRAVQSKDSRFDGWFFTAVTSTGIYCRPSCPAMTPKPENVRFHATAAAAQATGFRACKRCRPDATPGSPQWNSRADVVGRAMRLIGDGIVDREGVAGLANRLGYSSRHLNRLLVAEVGAGPIQLARAQRAQTARLLIETTDLAFSDVAFGAGFSSIRQFNDTVAEVFASTPTTLRLRRGRQPGGRPAGGPGWITLKLPFRAPLDGDALMAFLGDRAVPGVEELVEGTYRRTVTLTHGTAVVELTPHVDHVGCRLMLGDLRDLATAVQRCRRLLDLDADPLAVADVLGADPALETLITKAPGRRAPGHVDGFELAVRAVIGQQVSVKGARTVAGQLVAAYGEPLGETNGGLTHVFPTAASLAEIAAESFHGPRARGRALGGLAAAVTRGEIVIDAGADRDELRRRLLELAGIGAWTADYIAMRALGDPDVFLATDLGVRHALERLGLPSKPAEAAAHAQRWRPWRSYALHHLWGSLAC